MEFHLECLDFTIRNQPTRVIHLPTPTIHSGSILTGGPFSTADSVHLSLINATTLFPIWFLSLLYIMTKNEEQNERNQINETKALISLHISSPSLSSTHFRSNFVLSLGPISMRRELQLQKNEVKDECGMNEW